MRYDQHNALLQIAKRCNAECMSATDGAKPKEYTQITMPIFSKYERQASAIGATLVQLKYRIAVMNGVIKEQR